ncbi:hypothetical protein GCM10023189_14640 [Nibrella saemangeumensis]|uniref:DUF2085 domain-containing protein n=1 Tax=Nibrella saemangeumensis TaxID=1084526 RepID=A0ABP8MMG4_9BACT
MRTTITTRYLIAFTALFLVLHELHEQAHTSVGRLLCGCWGPRGFNVWHLCETCSMNGAYPLALMAGPLFSYALAWTGYYLMGQADRQRKALGFSLVFGSVMQARLLTAVMGGGDEVTLFRLITDQPVLGRWLGLTVTVLLAAPPLWRAFRQLPRPKQVVYWLGFAFVPLIVEAVVVFKGLDGLLQQGIGAEPGLLGMPMLVTVWTGLMALILIPTHRWLLSLFVSVETPHLKQLNEVR